MPLQLHSSKIATLLAGFLVIAVTATLGAAIWVAREQSTREWHRQLDNLSLLLAEQTAQEVKSACLILDSIAENVRVSQVDSDATLRERMGTLAQFASMRDKIQGLPQVDVATIVGAHGDVINFTRAHPAPAINLADRDYFQALQQQDRPGVQISRPVRNKGNGQWTFYLSRRLNGPHGEFLGLALIGFSSTFLSQFYGKINLGPGASVALYRRDYTHLARWPHDDKLMGQRNVGGSSYQVVDVLKKSHGVVSTTAPRLAQGGQQVARLGAARLVDKLPLIINVTVTDDLYLAQWRRYALVLVLVGGISVCAILAAFTVLIRSLQRREQDMEQMRALKTVAEAASVAKSAFLAMMSHEIRTPLTAIIGFAEIGMRADSPTGRHNAGAIILRNGRHLLDIINDILDMSKIEAGRMHLEHLPFAPLDVVAGVDAMMAAQADAKGVAYRTTVTYPFPAYVMGDPTRWKQILFNLTGNALKFTERGAVEVHLAYDAARARLTVTVTDTGIGIADEQRDQLFQPFSQGDSQVSRTHGGTGLGLYLVRQLARRMQGDVVVRSQRHAGSVFEVGIAAPLAPAVAWVDAPAAVRPQPVAAAADVCLHGHVLLAEDGPDNRILIVALLRRFGLTVDVVDNGAQAVAAALAGNHDLALLDIQMPVMDGLQAAQALQAAGYRPPLVALTANVMQDDVDRYASAGFACCIGKPIDVAALAAALARLLGQRAAEAVSPGPGLADLPGYAGMCRDWRHSLDDRLRELHDLLATGSLASAATLSHALRGNGTMFGYGGVTRLAADIEAAAARGDRASARAALEQLTALDELAPGR